VTRFVVPRPFLKWAGGKTQLLDDLLRHMPPAFESYHEPFVGGGALFFALHRVGKLRRATLSDLNAKLIDTYIAVRDRVEEVIDLLAACPHRKALFYELRAQDLCTISQPERAAPMIYLNRTCFNGLYRVNKSMTLFHEIMRRVSKTNLNLGRSDIGYPSVDTNSVYCYHSSFYGCLENQRVAAIATGCEADFLLIFIWPLLIQIL
jgi:site-specific DNA-adenine methylase